VGLRINTLLTTPATATEQLTAAGFDWHWLRPQSSTAIWIPAEQRSQLTHHELANSGGLYIQSLSSQLAAEVLAPQPGEQVLDLAAAPGGKTTHLAALMQNQGRLSAVESVRPRFFRLLETLKRQGVTIAKTYLMDGRSVGGKVGERFDRVLLDAPCSSESRFHLTDPKSFENWSLRKIKECARKQTGLICSAFAALCPGGRLLYATCSFAPEENEAIVQHLLDRYPGQAQLLALPPLPCRTQPGLQVFEQQRFSADLQQTCRILPDRWFSGFYLALIGKSSS
jgi:16S rRNA (cytosine1407-C5)-methyltransferase